MKKPEVIIKTKLSSTLILLFGGIFSTLAGIFLLLNPYVSDKGGLPNWVLGILFLPFGLISIFKLLDFRYLKIGENELEIKSLFRNRKIQKEEIIGYGIEKYKFQRSVANLSDGERIRLFCKKGSYKFHTTQLESIEEIKEFVKGKDVKENAFNREFYGGLIGGILFLLILISPVIYEKFEPKKAEGVSALEIDEGEVEAIGIPARFKRDINLVGETGEEIKFELKDYKNYIFVVDKNRTPKDMRTTTKDLIIFIENKEYAKELSNKEIRNLDSKKPKMVPVDKISILE